MADYINLISGFKFSGCIYHIHRTTHGFMLIRSRSCVYYDSLCVCVCGGGGGGGGGGGEFYLLCTPCVFSAHYTSPDVSWIPVWYIDDAGISAADDISVTCDTNTFLTTRDNKWDIDGLMQDSTNSMYLQWSYCSLTLSPRYYAPATVHCYKKCIHWDKINFQRQSNIDKNGPKNACAARLRCQHI